jgi:4-oxalocrotonate tautomerase
MPHIELKVPPRPTEVKRKLVQEMTDLAARIYEIPQEKWMIHILECPRENVGSGGQLLSDK